MALTLAELESELETIYKPLIGKSFEGCIHERNTKAVCTGGPRDVVVVEDDDVGALMEEIVDKVEEVASKLEPDNGEEKVWKGIVQHYHLGPTLWVKPYEGDDDDTSFTIADIEVLTGLNWVKKNYKAMVNITLE